MLLSNCLFASLIMQTFRMEQEDMLFMGDCAVGVNIFVLAVSIDRTLVTPTATAAVHLASSWKPTCDSICLYARHQVQADFGGRTLVNGHTEYLVLNAQSRWPTSSPVTQVSNFLCILCSHHIVAGLTQGCVQHTYHKSRSWDASSCIWCQLSTVSCAERQQ